MMKINAIYQMPLKKQLFIFAFIFLIVFLLGYGWDISNLKKKIITAQKVETDLKQQVNLIFTNEATHQALLTKYPEYQNQLTAWNKKLTSRSDLPELVKDILKIGATNNIYIISFNPDNEENDGLYTRIPVNIITVSSYNQLADFVSQLANMQHLVVIKKFIISNENKADEIGGEMAKKAADENLLTTKMRIEIYLMPEKTAHDE